MKLLLDENLPKGPKQDLGEHQIYTVREMGWLGFSNGKLLSLLVENEFDGFLTFDKQLQHQQNFSKYKVAVLILIAVSNRYRYVKKLVPEIKSALSSPLKPGPLIIGAL